MWETQIWSLGREDPLEKEMATHSSTLAWKILWTEEPGRLQSMRLQRVGRDWVAKLYVTILNAGNLGIPAFRAPETLGSSSTAHLPSQQSTAAPQDALDRQGLCPPCCWVLKVSPKVGHLHSRSISPHPKPQITAKPLPGESPVYQLSAAHRTAFTLKNAWTYWLKIKVIRVSSAV